MWSNFPDLVDKEQWNITSAGLMISGAVWVKNLHLVQNKSQTLSFWILEVVLLWKIILCLGIQSHPEDQGDFQQGSAVNISECHNQLELSIYNMCALTWYLLVPYETLNSINHYEDIYENSENLSKVMTYKGNMLHNTDTFVSLVTLWE